jgi:DNA-binding CsgD family transcriptional regulator
MPNPNTDELSEREREILCLVATGASNKEIAQQLSISANTVKVHLRNVFAKIGASSRTEAAMYALRAGLVAGSSLIDVIEPELAGELEAEKDGPEPQPEKPLPLAEMPAPVAEPEIRRQPIDRKWLIAGAVLLLALTGLYAWWKNRTPVVAVQPAPEDVAERWQNRAALPTPRFGLAAVAYNGAIYAIGGKVAGGPSGVVEKYDPEQNAWKSLAPKPVPAYDIAAATVGGEIYIPGGRLAADGRVTDVLEIYDPLQDRWRQGAHMPVGLSAYALAAFEGQIYLFGGFDGRQYVDAVYVYAPASDSWSQVDRLPEARGYAGSAVANGKIYLLGGNTGLRMLDDNLIYLPTHLKSENAWGQAQSLPKGRYGMGVTSVADIIEVVGGAEDGISTPLSLSYFPLKNTWQEFGAIQGQNPIQPALVTLGNFLYVIGGQVDGAPTGQNLAYQAIYSLSFPIIR